LKQYKDDKNILREIILNLQKAMELISFSANDGISLANLFSKVTKDSYYKAVRFSMQEILIQNEIPTSSVVGVSDLHNRQAFGFLIKEKRFIDLYKNLFIGKKFYRFICLKLSI
jgi:hypothetical protein